MSPSVLVLVLVLAVLFTGATADLKTFLSEKKEWSDVCVKETGFKAGDPTAVWKGEGVDTQEGRCYMGCMMEKATVIVNGEFSPENAKELAEQCFAGEVLATMREVLDTCGAEVKTTDRCETGPVLMQCLMKIKAAKGV
ncbi:General odorant-binding protein 28a [Gryllus bimaculatus]|nr:General odorant-binding protein 28a [Gryllus bimaculatus]